MSLHKKDHRSQTPKKHSLGLNQTTISPAMARAFPAPLLGPAASMRAHGHAATACISEGGVPVSPPPPPLPPFPFPQHTRAANRGNLGNQPTKQLTMTGSLLSLSLSRLTLGVVRLAVSSSPTKTALLSIASDGTGDYDGVACVTASFDQTACYPAGRNPISDSTSLGDDASTYFAVRCPPRSHGARTPSANGVTVVRPPAEGQPCNTS